MRLRESSITEQRHDCCTPVTHTCCNIHARNMSIIQSRRSAHAQHNMLQQAPRCRQDMLRRAAAALPVAKQYCNILNMWNIMVAGHLRCPACCHPSLRRFSQAAPTALRSAAAYPCCGLRPPHADEPKWLKRVGCSTSRRIALRLPRRSVTLSAPSVSQACCWECASMGIVHAASSNFTCMSGRYCCLPSLGSLSDKRSCWHAGDCPDAN